GANVGLLTIVGSKAVGSTGKVYAFEPHPRIFKYLKGNIELNHSKNVNARNIALGEKVGTVTFSDQRMDDGNHIVPEGTGMKVKMERLDEALSPVKKINLLKIDVEGYERFVFQGGRSCLERTQCIYFESSRELFQRYSYECSDLLMDLRSTGFT